MSTSAPLSPGDVLDGKYEIRQVLGEGAMGIVYEATHTILGDRVAIKCIRRDRPSEIAITRFMREARVVRAIRSAHAVKVLEVGLLSNQTPYIVMERLRGSNLEDHIQACGALPAQEAADLLIQTCDGLAEAHKNGVVHRDIKPENLFLAQDPDGQVTLKVLDFGVAKMLSPDSAEREQSKTRDPIGTPLFMSPEQIQGGELDARSDVWALGVLLYYLLSERFPFSSPTAEGLLVQICTTAPLPLAEYRADLAPELLALVDACLQRAPDHRPSSVHEIAVALRPFASPRVLPLVERVGRILLPGTSDDPGAGASAPQETREEVSASLAQTLPEMQPAPGAPPPEAPLARHPRGRRALFVWFLLPPLLWLGWTIVSPARGVSPAGSFSSSLSPPSDPVLESSPVPEAPPPRSSLPPAITPAPSGSAPALSPHPRPPPPRTRPSTPPNPTPSPAGSRADDLKKSAIQDRK